MDDMNNTIRLANGVELPRVGLGTFRATGDHVKQAVTAAIHNDIRHIDTAAIYKNEQDIAQALREEEDLSRQQVFITSKVSPYQHGSVKATQACQDILQRLQTDFVDLLLIHWPGAARTDPNSPLNAELRWQTWRVLEQMYCEGKARAIGVSNYSSHHLQELLDKAAVKPMVNQFEVHPRRPERALRQACAAAGVAVVAYASLGCGELLKHQVVKEVASQTGRSEAQVLLMWGLQNGCAVIPKSVHSEYIAQYSPDQLLCHQLSQRHMAALDALEDGHKYCWDPSGIL